MPTLPTATAEPFRASLVLSARGALKLPGAKEARTLPLPWPLALAPRVPSALSGRPSSETGLALSTPPSSLGLRTPSGYSSQAGDHRDRLNTFLRRADPSNIRAACPTWRSAAVPPFSSSGLGTGHTALSHPSLKRVSKEEQPRSAPRRHHLPAPHKPSQ